MSLIANAAAVSPQDASRALRNCDRERSACHLILAYSLIGHAKTLQANELRAEYAAHAVRRASELLYRRYVEMLYLLWGAAQAKSYDLADYGCIFATLLKSDFVTLYPALLDPRAVTVRNSVAHDDWDYISFSDEILLRDKKKDNQKEDTVTISVDALLALAEGYAHLGGCLLPDVVAMQILESACTHIQRLESIWASVISDDAETRRAAIELIGWYANTVRPGNPRRIRKHAGGTKARSAPAG